MTLACHAFFVDVVTLKILHLLLTSLGIGVVGPPPPSPTFPAKFFGIHFGVPFIRNPRLYSPSVPFDAPWPKTGGNLNPIGSKLGKRGIILTFLIFTVIIVLIDIFIPHC
jgi:hypothetical protein